MSFRQLVGRRLHGSPRQPPQYVPPPGPPAEQVWGTYYLIPQTGIIDTATWQEVDRWTLATELVTADDTIRALGFEFRVDDGLTSTTGEVTGAGTVYRNDVTNDVLTNTDAGQTATSITTVPWAKDLIEAAATLEWRLSFDGADVVLEVLGVVTGTRVVMGALWLSLPFTYVAPT